MLSQIPKRNVVMSLHHYRLNEFTLHESNVVGKEIWYLDNNKRVEFVVDNVYRIDVDCVKEYLPSKVLWSRKDDTFHLIYYTNDEFLPRPFAGEENVYCFYVRCCSHNMILQYDGRVQKLFLDQTVAGEDICYMFFVGESDYQYLMRGDLKESVSEVWSGLDECLTKLSELSRR